MKQWTELYDNFQLGAKCMQQRMPLIPLYPNETYREYTATYQESWKQW